MASKPMIVFVPGLWVGPTVWSSVTDILQSPFINYPTATVSLPSTGTASPKNPNLHHDIRAIRSAITSPIKLEGKDILLVVHSAGGFLGPNAIKGLTKKERRAQGKKGGVVGIVFVAGYPVEEGYQHRPMPFMDFQGDRMYCHSPRELLLNDLADSEAQKWLRRFRHQPASGWDDVTTYCGWKDVPSVYLVCEQDAVLPAWLQRQVAELAGSEIESCEGGHMAMISQPAKVAEVVLKAAVTLRG